MRIRLLTLSAILTLTLCNTPVSAQVANTGTIWGHKVKMPGIELGKTPPSAEIVTLDGGQPTSADPFNFSSVSAGNHTVAVTVPSGWSVGYTLCYNSTSCHTNTPTPGNSVVVNVPGGGYADLWWHFTQGTEKIQGYKLDHLGNLFSNPNVIISVNNQILSTSTNPYVANVIAGNNTVQSTAPNGYDVYYSVCINCFSHPASSFVKGSQATVNIPSGGYADIYWKYVTPAQVNFTLPASTVLTPLFSGSLFTEVYQGYANIYAPEVMFVNGIYKMWYGGGGADIKDRIHYAESLDGATWTKKGAVIEAPAPHYNANDPSVIKVGNTYYMYMTISESDLLDRIYVSTSTDGLTWTTPSKVLDKGNFTWNSRYVARPTVIYDNGTFKMWFDTTNGSNFSDPVININVGYATSSNGLDWQVHPEMVFQGYAANDVKKIQNTFVMLIQGAWEGTHIATSPDGIVWTKQGTLIPPDSGNSSSIPGHLTPSLFIDPTTGKPKTVYMGAGVSGTSIGYDRNAIYKYLLKEGELEKFIPVTSVPTVTSTPVIIPPVIQPTATTTNTQNPSPISETPTEVRLVNDQGTIYLIKDDQKQGITSPGMLYSYGFEFKDAQPVTSSDKLLPTAELLLPGNGSLVKSSEDSTVWLISNGFKYGFVSEQVFLNLGFKFNSVLIVTAPELDKLVAGLPLSDSTAAHLDNVDINLNGTIFWIFGGKKYGYPSREIYNSWHKDDDYSQVVPGNTADSNLPFGGVISKRVLN